MDATDLARNLQAGVGVDLDGGQVDAEVLRELCIRPAGPVDPRGFRLRGATVCGTLDLAGVELPFPLRFENCVFESAPILHRAKVRELAFVDGCRLPGLFANGIAVQGDVNLSRSHVEGAHPTTASTSRSAAIWLCESEIGGRLLWTR